MKLNIILCYSEDKCFPGMLLRGIFAMVFLDKNITKDARADVFLSELL